VSAACRDIDKWMLFVMQIFLWKYNHKQDPFQNATPDWKEAGSRDEESVPRLRDWSPPTVSPGPHFERREVREHVG
jgi:hypothetical protein